MAFDARRDGSSGRASAHHACLASCPARPYVVDADIETGYRMMAEDREREAEAMEWAEALIGDVLHG
ncbi:MAG: hypothetical protein IT208_14570 [Chthonomonadales bacterium]|nr:hypothetical protein [Chthonomonadales bacterium]